MSLPLNSKNNCQTITLKQLIKQLFKKYSLEYDKHFDVWICGLDKNQIIVKDKPFYCCHFNTFNRSEDGTDIFKWFEFEIEDYEFEIVNVCKDIIEYHLFVKLVDIDRSPAKYNCY